ncbi:MAG: AMP-binding protein, partial [Tepidisphaeraceae bacterium]
MLLEPLLRHARNEPDRIAVIDESGSYTNQSLARMAFGLGAFLKTKTSRGTVGLLLPAGAGFVAGFYGTLLANKVPVPINFLMGAREVAHILQDSQIDTVLTHPLLAGRLEGLGVNVVDLSQLAGQLGDVQPYAPPEHGP